MVISVLNVIQGSIEKVLESLKFDMLKPVDSNFSFSQKTKQNMIAVMKKY